jgi:hypothetical protein
MAPLRGPLKLWIRLDADAPSDPRVGEIADRLDIDTAHAFGLVAAVWCAMAHHAVEGSLSAVSGRALEDWAGWRGPRGKFAEVFLSLFTDETRAVPGWRDQQGKLIELAAKDAERQRVRYEAEKARRLAEESGDTPPTGSGDSADSPRSIAGASDATRQHTTEQDNGSVVRDAREVTLALTVAANQGITARWQEQPNPLRSSHPSALQLAEMVVAEGIPLDVARSAIYSACVGSKLDRPPRSLNYFAEVVRAVWLDEQAKRAAAAGDAPAVIPLRPSRTDPGATLDQLLKAEREKRAAGGQS